MLGLNFLTYGCEVVPCFPIVNITIGKHGGSGIWLNKMLVVAFVRIFKPKSRLKLI